MLEPGFDFARIRRQICRQLYMVIERKVEILAAFTRRLHKSHSRFLGALKLCVIRHAVASVEQNSERDRLLFVREKALAVAHPLELERRHARGRIGHARRWAAAAALGVVSGDVSGIHEGHRANDGRTGDH